MKLLMLDTSTVVASAAIISEKKLIGEVIVNHEKKHAEKLMLCIDHLLKDVNMTIKEMDVFGIVSGPGSFTGLRIGMSTIKGFAQVCGKPVVGVSTLASLAANLPYADGMICPILDAQRNCLYSGLYKYENNELTQCVPDQEITIENLIVQLSEYQNDKIYIPGDAQEKYFDQIAEKIPNAVKVCSYAGMNRASSAAFLALEKLQKGSFDDYRTIEPVYLRRSYAEEKQ